jgi:hypothetical protein
MRRGTQIRCSLTCHARRLETSTFDILQGKSPDYSSQLRQIWRGSGVDKASVSLEPSSMDKASVALEPSGVVSVWQYLVVVLPDRNRVRAHACVRVLGLG